jgi:predicted AAA+ superfamily ATPase
MVDLLLVRRLLPWQRNVGKRLVKSPKVDVRDIGVARALLGLGTKEEVPGRPVVGRSCEAFVIENLLSVAPERTEASFYRASGGAEIDLVLTLPGREPWSLEVKRSLDPRPGKGFHSAGADVEPEARFVVYPGAERFAMAKGIEAVSLTALAAEVAAAGRA